MCLVRTPLRVRAPATWPLPGDDPVDFEDDVAIYEPLSGLAMVGREFAKVVRRFMFEHIRCSGTTNTRLLLHRLRHPSLQYLHEKPMFGRSLDLALSRYCNILPALEVITICRAMKSLTLRTARVEYQEGAPPRCPLDFPIELVNSINSCIHIVKLVLNSTTHAPTVDHLMTMSAHLPNLTYLDIETLATGESANYDHHLDNLDNTVRFPQVTHLALGLDVGIPAGVEGPLHVFDQCLRLFHAPMHLPRLRYLDLRRRVGGSLEFLVQKGYQLEHLGLESASELTITSFLPQFAPSLVRLNITTTYAFEREYCFQHINIREIIVEDSKYRESDPANRSLLDFVSWVLCARVPNLTLVVVRSNNLPHSRVRCSFERTVALERTDAFKRVWKVLPVPMPVIRWEDAWTD